MIELSQSTKKTPKHEQKTACCSEVFVELFRAVSISASGKKTKFMRSSKNHENASNPPRRKKYIGGSVGRFFGYNPLKKGGMTWAQVYPVRR